MATDNAVDTQEDTKIQTQFPNLWTVKFFNDDFTPMEFVIAILKEVFQQTEKDAIAITMKIHHEGDAIVGLYPRDIAETKARKTTILAEDYAHPLKVQALAV